MKVETVIAVLMTISCVRAVTYSRALPQNLSINRDPRVLIPYTIPAEDCKTGVSTYPDGDCYSSADCTRLGGTATTQRCHKNLGICCYFRVTCGGTLSRRDTIFTNKNYPNTEPGATVIFRNTVTCSATVDRITVTGGICQVKLDFKEFQLAAAVNGTCSKDYLEVLGSTTANVPKFCGTRTGQSYVLNMASTGTAISLMTTIGNGTDIRKWKIAVTQIPCTKLQAASVFDATTTTAAPATTTTTAATTTTTTTTVAPTTTSTTCTSTLNAAVSGICLSAANCTSRSGTASGTCADGKTCCVQAVKCNGAISSNGTVFQNTAYPSTTATAGTCSATVSDIATSRISRDICQIKLTMIAFELVAASANGDCVTDYLQVSGTATSSPKLCGTLTGNTYYFGVTQASAPKLDITLGSSSTARKWLIKVEYIYCNQTQGSTTFPVNPIECSSNGVFGTCTEQSACTGTGKSYAVNCPNSNGVCCTVKATCAGSITANNTNFLSTRFPENELNVAKDCVGTIDTSDTNLCQVKLTFKRFKLKQPDVQGACNAAERLTITGAATPTVNVPVLCGDNDNQHLFLKVTQGTPIVMTVKQGTDGGSIYNILVTKYLCDSTEKAPDGCHQYYTATDGKFTSFNFKKPTAASELTGATVNHHLQNLNYDACFKKVTNGCKVTLNAGSASDKYRFMMTGLANSVAEAGNVGVAGGVLTAAQAATCVDYLQLADSTYLQGTTPVVDSKLCGRHLPTTTAPTTRVNLISIKVVTNNAELPAEDTANFGFDIDYTQQTTC